MAHSKNSAAKCSKFVGKFDYYLHVCGKMCRCQLDGHNHRTFKRSRVGCSLSITKKGPWKYTIAKKRFKCKRKRPFKITLRPDYYFRKK